MEILNALKNVDFLKSLSIEELKDLKNASFLKEYEKNEVIKSEHSYVRAIPIILEGAVDIRLVNNTKNKEAFLYSLKEGNTCATTISAGIFKEKVELKVVAATYTKILFVPLDYFLSTLRKHPDIFETLLYDYYKIFMMLINSMSGIAFDTLEERLIKHLDHKSKIMNNKEIEITHEELAMELGTSREVITRILKDLEHQNLLKIHRGRIEIFFEDK